MNPFRSRAKARVWAERRGGLVSWSMSERAGWIPMVRIQRETFTWCYEVTDSQGKVVLADNGASFTDTVCDALEGVHAVRRIENAGHRLKHSYPELAERARS